jgi:hypothetical protein
MISSGPDNEEMDDFELYEHLKDDPSMSKESRKEFEDKSSRCLGCKPSLAVNTLGVWLFIQCAISVLLQRTG